MMKAIIQIKLAVIFFLFCAGGSHAQFIQTDEFDFWEDQSSHSYSVNGVSFSGAYICSGDSTLRCGNCSNGTGSVTLTLAVTPNCDSIQLNFMMAWGNQPVLTVDGVRLGLLSTATSCGYDSILITNAGSYSADGAVIVSIRDTILACAGDFQVARMQVFSNGTGTSTGNTNDVLQNNLILYPNPVSGILSLKFFHSSDEAEVIIFDVNGKLVYMENINSINYLFNKEIDMGSTEPGFYFVRLRTASESITKKISVMHQ